MGTADTKTKGKKKGCCSCKKEIFIAYWDFTLMNQDEITLKRGERVAWLKDKYSPDPFGEKQLRWKWSKVRKIEGSKEKGYIPRSFLVPEAEYLEQTLYKNTSWYIGRTWPLEAEKELAKNNYDKGSFVVCGPPEYKSAKNMPEYSLTVRVSEKEHKSRAMGVRIRRDNCGRYYIKRGSYAPNILHLIRSINGTPNLLPVKLRYPPPMNEGQTPEYMKSDIHPIPAPPDHPYRCLFGATPGKGPTSEGTPKPGTAEESKLPILNSSEFQVIETVGKGNFGKVMKAIWLPKTKAKGKDVHVAIKALKGAANQKELEEFLKEADILAGLDHANIIRLHGLCKDKGPVWLVTEFMNQGSLEKYLRGQLEKKQRLADAKLTEILYQIARGMSYLVGENIVHRDLAARNVLVSEVSIGTSTISVKICDFGLSLTEDASPAEKNTDELPYKWMAPESLTKNKEFTHQSDVWSFGVVIYEVMTHGGVPYIGVANDEILGYLKAGNRLEQRDIPSEIYEIALKCWKENPQERPEFKDLLGEFDALLYDKMFR